MDDGLPATKIAYGVLESASVSPKRGDDPGEIVLGECLRELAGRRRVHAARDGKYGIVLVKCFIHSAKGEEDARREWQKHQRLLERGLPLPEPYYLAAARGHGYLVASRYLSGASTLKEEIDEAPGARFEELFSRVLRLVRLAHDCGVCQRDIHLQNFLLHEGELYSIDAEGYHFFQGGVSAAERDRNLARLVANVTMERQGLALKMLPAYEPDPSRCALLEESVRRCVPGQMRRRVVRFTRKTRRTCSAFVRETRPGRTLLHVRGCREALVQAMREDPDALVESGMRLKEGSRSQVSEVIVGGKTYVLKRFRHANWLERALHVVTSSRSLRSWTAGHTLLLLGLETVRPLVCLERRSGFLPVDEFLLMERDEGTALQVFVRSDVDASVRMTAKESCRAFFRTCALLRASHGDTKASNFHVQPDGRVRILDLDRFRFFGSRMMTGRRQKNDRRRFRANARKFPQGRDIFHSIEEVTRGR